MKDTTIKLSGMSIRAFDERSRAKGEDVNRYYLAMLRNDDGDSITVRPSKKQLLRLIAGERVDVQITQAQTVLDLGNLEEDQKPQEPQDAAQG